MNATRSNARLRLRWRLGKPAALAHAAAGIIESPRLVGIVRAHPDDTPRKAPR
jgi:hypothetical protein